MLCPYIPGATTPREDREVYHGPADLLPGPVTLATGCRLGMWLKLDEGWDDVT